MRIVTRMIGLLVLVALTSGCSLSPEARGGRERALKESIEAFVQSAVQKKWADIYKISDGGFGSPEKLRDHLSKPWVQEAVLTDGTIASMAWVDDGLAKVKVNWSFHSGSVLSYSSETFVWAWDGGIWKYKGRTLR